MSKIQKNILIEDLVVLKPAAVKYLQLSGIRCLECGEPIWGTLQEAAEEKGFNDTDLERIVTDLNQLK